MLLDQLYHKAILSPTTVTHNSISFIKSSTTDLSSAETRPLDERDGFPLAANEAFSSLNTVTTAPETFEAQISVQHD